MCLHDCRDRIPGHTDAAAQLPVVMDVSQVEKPEMCVLLPWLLLDSEAAGSDTSARDPELQTLTAFPSVVPVLYVPVHPPLGVQMSVQSYTGILLCWGCSTGYGLKKRDRSNFSCYHISV